MCEHLSKSDEEGGQDVLPGIDAMTGHLPPGRYRTTLQELHNRFVAAPEYSSSDTRPEVWLGLRDYLAAWCAAEAELGAKLIRALWVAGSFVSSELNPEDIDVSPLYDAEVVAACTGQRGMGKVKRLLGDRTAVARTFKVEAFPVPWKAHESTLLPDRLPPADREMLAVRGGVDDWWQRVRPPGPKRPPEKPKNFAERGYVEVER